MRAAAIEPSDPFINTGIADYEKTHGNPEAALEYYKKVLAEAWNSDQSAYALNNMADMYRRLGQPDKAEACLRKGSTLPKRAIDWQGNWWQHIIPLIKDYFHLGSAHGQN
jgi:tetratricopeptide (TPR) repeat protein